MVRETQLSPANLIWPLFVCPGSGTEEPIDSLPGAAPTAPRRSIPII